ncbi:Class E basic helix-loop-helix protein 41 [Goodea atripinnis]|uniref:Class E basic helix-loop-helix protein 41 n=1 Tax=Goodea atripinnis TaxID=208336 RepID=A0ABV0NU04_9TELE
MDERIPHLQDRQFMEHPDFLGMDFPPLYMCKSKRGIKREDGGKDAYKLPHRLIEKKRRDRINECIGQLKDLLPEHLKLSVRTGRSINKSFEALQKLRTQVTLFISNRRSGTWRKRWCWS